MCIIFGEKEPIRRIAKRRILIVKYCYLDAGVIHSWYKGKKYVLNQEYNGILQQSLGNTPYGTYFLEVGFHSYSNKVWHKTAGLGVPIYGPTLLILYTGRSGIYTLDYIRNYTKSPIVKVYGYIPKGAEYLKNDRGEYISNKIVLTNYEEVVSTNQYV